MSVMTALRLKSEPEPEPKVTGRILFGNVRTVEWDKDDLKSVLKAQKAFEDGLLTGMAAFETVEVPSYYGGGTVKEEQSTRTFHPEVEQIRMTAQFAGG